MIYLEESEIQRAQVEISVIVPVRNGAATIRECLGALCSQDFPKDKYEVIVIDNNSTDSTTAIARSIGDVVTIFEEQRGVSNARNAGIRASRGHILAFTDSDCVPANNWLKEIAAKMATCDAITGYSDSIYRNLVGRVIAYLYQQEMNSFIDLELTKRLDTRNSAIRKDLLEEAGGFDTHILFGNEDALLGAVLMEKGIVIHYAKTMVIHHVEESRMRVVVAKARQRMRAYSYIDRSFSDPFKIKYFPELLEMKEDRKHVLIVQVRKNVIANAIVRIFSALATTVAISLFHAFSFSWGMSIYFYKLTNRIAALSAYGGAAE